MSIQIQLQRIQEAKNAISAILVELGIAAAEDKLDVLAEKLATIEKRSEGNLTVSGSWVHVTQGYYPEDMAKQVQEADRAATFIEAVADDDADKLTITAHNNQQTGYVIGTGDKTASATVTLSIDGDTITAVYDNGISTQKKTITKTIGSGDYSAGVTLEAGAGSVSVTGTDVTLTELDVKPSLGFYITATGSGSVSATGTATIGTAGYLAEDSKTATDTASSNTQTKYYALKNGSVNVTGGVLQAGNGSVSATGTGITLTESTTQPSSGMYITATGSGRVSRTAIREARTEGYIDTKPSAPVIDTDSLDSDIATKYYTLPSTFADTASGDAIAANILSGKKAWVDGAEVTGNMADHGAVNVSINPLDSSSTESYTQTNPGYYTSINVTIDDDLENALAAI